MNELTFNPGIVADSSAPAPAASPAVPPASPVATPATPTRAETELAGRLVRIRWQADDLAAIIAYIDGGTAGSPGDRCVRGPTDPDDFPAVGQQYRFFGKWELHAKYGEQFNFWTYTRVVPHDRAGVVAYLVAVADSIGEGRARKIWDAFGSDSVRIVREEPERIAGAGIMRIEAAREAAISLAEEVEFESVKIDLLALFAGRGFQAGKLIKETIKRWGAKAPEFIRRNPYLLMLRKMPSAGFKRCDKLYLDLGGDRGRLKRQALCAWDYLRRDSSGHTWFQARTVGQAVLDAVPAAVADPKRALRLAIKAGKLAKRRDDAGEVWLAETRHAWNEQTVAIKVQELLAAVPRDTLLWPDVADLGDAITPHQREKLAAATAGAFGLLTGTPGTGKTHTVGKLIAEVGRRYGPKSIAACAPTGKAAVRLTAALNLHGCPITATTVHTLLEIGRNGHDGDGWGFQRNASNPLDQKFVLVDECSMLDTNLAADLLSACAPTTHVLWIGDPYQLPPVGHGAPLRDLIAAQVPNGELSEIRRNAGMIVRACASIKDGASYETTDKPDPSAGINLWHIEADQPVAQVQRLLGLYRDFKRAAADGKETFRSKQHLLWDIQVIVPTNKSGELGRRAINDLLQTELNATGAKCDPNPFRIGDKIVCLKNQHLPAADPDDLPAATGVECYVANGDIGHVLHVEQRLTVAQFSTPTRVVRIPMGKQREGDDEGTAGGNGGSAGESEGRGGRGCDFDLAYAITCHKSQGAEWPVVIILGDASAGARRVCDRNWLYTAISRAGQLAVTIGRRGVLEQMARRQSLDKRRTFLVELLKGGST